MVKSMIMVLAIVGLSTVKFGQGCEILANQVSDDDKNFIVNKHNDLRKQIANDLVGGQPRGVNLKRMHYDEALASAAQQIAETCNFEHVTVNDGRWHAVGQNLYTSYSTAGDNGGADWNKAIQAWFDEHSIYSFSNNFNHGTGHYTQLVWADTDSVGCGYTYFRTGGDFSYQKLYVCNYGPAGNYIGQYPYKTGDSGCEDLC